MKAIIYSRVSTDEQKENGFSLQDQDERLRKYCRINKIEIVANYREDHSAKNFNRPKFKQFLEDVKSKRIKVDTFLCVRVDRFSRNMDLSIEMIKRFKTMGISLKTIEQDLEINSPEALLPYLIHLALPQIENERRSVNTKRGMRRAMTEGRWVSTPPHGYKMESKALVIDEKVAPYVKRGFDLLSSGQFSAEEVRKTLWSEDFKVCKQTWLNIIKNVLYIGKIRIAPWKDEPEVIVQGIHPPIISEETFEKVQRVMGRKSKNWPGGLKVDESLPLRGFLTCDCCGGKITGSASTGRRKDKHYYYHCQRGCKRRFRANEANEILQAHLQSYVIPKEVSSMYLEVLKDVFDSEQQAKKLKIEEFQKLAMKLEERLRNLDDDSVDRKITHEQYQKSYQRYNDQLNQVKDQMEDLSMEKSEFDEYLKFGVYFQTNLNEIYSKADVYQKQSIIGSIFPEGLTFSEKNYRTTRLNEFVSMVYTDIKGFDGDIKEKATKNGGFSLNAPPLGLEPRTP